MLLAPLVDHGGEPLICGHPLNKISQTSLSLPLPVKLLLILSFPLEVRSGFLNLGTQQWVKPLATAVGASQSLAA